MNRALRAQEAGRYLADALGLPQPFSAQAMWQMGRSAVVPTVRIGRRVFFLTDRLDAYVRAGGSPVVARRVDDA
jgi:hypothetical protein